MQSAQKNENTAVLHRLQREWAIYLALGLSFLLGGYALLAGSWEPRSAVIWAAAGGVMLACHFGTLWLRLKENRPKDGGESALYPTLGLANGITITRAILVAGLAGFLFSPWPAGWLAWVPGALFLMDGLMDFADGAAARLTGRVTALGERLDMQWDSAGVLIACGLVVMYGQASPLYLWVGLARYLYLFGLWLHRRAGGSVRDLPPSRFRRAIAGLQMGYLAGALLPVFSPPATSVVALLFMAPHFLGFVRDFFHVTSLFNRPALAAKLPGWAASALPLVLPGWAASALPLVLRGGLVFLLARMAVLAAGEFAATAWFRGFALLAVVALALGAAGRLAGLGVVFAAGFALRSAPGDLSWWMLLFLGALLFLVGSGRFSIWKPEDALIDRRVGDPRPEARG